jgi:hypothetical protein
VAPNSSLLLLKAKAVSGEERSNWTKDVKGFFFFRILEIGEARKELLEYRLENYRHL